MAELTTLARPYAKAAFQSALDDGALAVDAEAASALKLNPGDRLCWAPR